MRPPITALLVLLCTSAYAAEQFVRPQNGDCVPAGTGASTSVQLFPEAFMVVGGEQSQTGLSTQIDFAVGFSVEYFPTYKVVTNSIANETYVLYQCGASAPDFSAFPEGAKFFQVPLTSISAPETVPYAFIDFLGLGDRVHDVSPYVTSPCGQALLTSCPGRTAPDFMALSNVTLLDSTVGSAVDGMVATTPYAYGKTFTVSAAQDPGMLNRAEWVKFVALFFNRERNASDIFDAIKAQYEEIKAKAASSAADKPVVAWATHFKYDTDESYQLSFDPYQQELTQNAGGVMLDRKALKAVKGVQGDSFDPTSPTLVYAWGAEGAFATKEAAKAAYLEALKQADIIIDETYSMDPTKYDSAAMLAEYGFTAQEAAAVPAIAAQKVFREDGRLSYSDAAGYGLDWFESAIARPDMVLEDMVRVVQPAAAEAGQTFTWMRNIFTEDPVVVGPDACPTKTACTAAPATICPFVQMCPEGQAPALLESTADGQCAYAACGEEAAAAADGAPGNAAAMMAPAVLLTLALVFFVELLMHLC